MRRAPLFWSVLLLAVAMSFTHAWQLGWTCDDAYISFRYAKNFVDGHGLVFNLDAKEPPVEGYTNFAWTMWLAVGIALGFVGDWLETWSIFWGCALHAATVFVLGVLSWRSSRGTAVVPIAAPAYAASYAAASLAPAGLETAMFTLLGVCMYWLSVERRCGRQLWMLGCLGVLAATTRPDGALFVGAAGAMVLFDALRARSLRIAVAYGLPIAACMVPYLLWRHAYYGEWVPNTFFAKSGGDPNLAPGIAYAKDYFVCYAFALLPALLALIVLPLRPADRFAAVDPWNARRSGAALWSFVLPYLAFVVWVGGDFMFGRFLVPVTPLLLLALDHALKDLPKLRLPALGVAVFGMLFRIDPPYLTDYSAPVSDNRAISMAPLGDSGLTIAEYSRRAGHELARVFQGLDVRIGIAGAHANFAYRTGVPVAVECAAGLTDAYIAHLPVPTRSKVGHERPWPMYPGYLERRGVHFMLETTYATGGIADAWRDIGFPVPGLHDGLEMPMRVVVYDRELMRQILERQPKLKGTDVEGAIDLYLADLANKSKEQVAKDFASMKTIYFDHNEDPARREVFEQFLK